MNKSVFFAKVFNVSVTQSDNQNTYTRQILIRKAISTNPDVKSQLAVETTTLDGKQILLETVGTASHIEDAFSNFSEETANTVANTFCLRTLEEINEVQDIDFKVEGVGYDRVAE